LSILIGCYPAVSGRIGGNHMDDFRPASKITVSSE
jgi:hypothetical protein